MPDFTIGPLSLGFALLVPAIYWLASRGVAGTAEESGNSIPRVLVPYLTTFAIAGFIIGGLMQPGLDQIIECSRGTQTGTQCLSEFDPEAKDEKASEAKQAASET
ncbi:hypothetical protein DBR33_02835 [Stenotrophomonas sp. HMWF022]|uniref:hypothetical protein n=1 Tax=Stenotrophomonas sp. HMWF023 TaxID=2056859 RepID=UPI000D37864B|nr:hypothetical protein [Stenotrophomonas sp. HMWF023]PTS73917.1 hypothetical protein DBR20_15070 [Stenotrophomonas sp. HMWF023]PTT56044.1 hypothetical protein DBR33_02835 [Stenotrophomonas sp. HMWF022]